jgi:hypothetical protein
MQRRLKCNTAQVNEYLAGLSSDITFQFVGANSYNVSDSQLLNTADEIV